jgi:hypothetical protein
MKRRTDDDAVRKVEEMLDGLEPVELPPFYRERLLARLRRGERREPSGARGARVAWAVAAVCAVALLVVVLSGRNDSGPAPLGAPVETQGFSANIDPVMPVDNSVVSSSDVEIVAAIYPPIENGIVRLYVDDTDVTGLAEVTDDYVMYSPGSHFAEGEHIVTIEVRDGSGRKLSDVSWLFYTLNGETRTPGGSI